MLSQPAAGCRFILLNYILQLLRKTIGVFQHIQTCPLITGETPFHLLSEAVSEGATVKCLTGFLFKTQNTKTDVIVTAALIINLTDTN